MTRCFPTDTPEEMQISREQLDALTRFIKSNFSINCPHLQLINVKYTSTERVAIQGDFAHDRTKYFTVSLMYSSIYNRNRPWYFLSLVEEQRITSAEVRVDVFDLDIREQRLAFFNRLRVRSPYISKSNSSVNSTPDESESPSPLSNGARVFSTEIKM